MISSSTKVIAASGVLKAAASPAAAPAAAAARRFCFASPASPARLEATAPANCTLGPSRPRLDPPPMLNTPATNFTHDHAPRHLAKILPEGQLELRNAAAGRLGAKRIQEVSHHEGGGHDDQQAANHEDRGRLARQPDEREPIQVLHPLLKGDHGQPGAQAHKRRSEKPAGSGRGVSGQTAPIQSHSQTILQIHVNGLVQGRLRLNWALRQLVQPGSSARLARGFHP